MNVFSVMCSALCVLSEWHPNSIWPLLPEHSNNAISQLPIDNSPSSTNIRKGNDNFFWANFGTQSSRNRFSLPNRVLLHLCRPPSDSSFLALPSAVPFASSEHYSFTFTFSVSFFSLLGPTILGCCHPLGPLFLPLCLFRHWVEHSLSLPSSSAPLLSWW